MHACIPYFVYKYTHTCVPHMYSHACHADIYACLPGFVPKYTHIQVIAAVADVNRLEEKRPPVPAGVRPDIEVRSNDGNERIRHSIALD